MKYPIRINKYFLLKNICSRREADRLIEQGRIFVNDKKAILGQTINECDKITYDTVVSDLPKTYEYYAFNKPIGVVSHNPQKDELGIDDVIHIKTRIYPIGRLDKASHGLMLLSNDGRIVDALLNPKRDHEKEYKVKVDKNVTARFLKKMERGVMIERYFTKPTIARPIDARAFSLILTEGKKHQIRRMCSALGYRVVDLQRIRILDIKLEKLKVGAYRKLSQKEVKQFTDKLIDA